LNAFDTLKAHHEAAERQAAFIKEVLTIDKTSWSTYVDVDPDQQWNDCNAQWRGDIKRLAKIHGINLP